MALPRFVAKDWRFRKPPSSARRRPQPSALPAKGAGFEADPGRLSHGVHPGAIVIAMGAVFVFLLTLAFFMTGDLASNLNLYGVAGFAIIFFGLMLGLSARVAQDARWGGGSRSTLAEFAAGNVAIATGTISGREALIQILVLPATLAAGMVIIGAIFRLVR